MNSVFERFQQKRQQSQQQQPNPFASPEAFQQASGQMMNNLNQMGMTPETGVWRNPILLHQGVRSCLLAKFAPSKLQMRRLRQRLSKKKPFSVQALAQ